MIAQQHFRRGSNLINKYALSNPNSTSAAGWTQGSNVYTFSNVSIGKSNAAYALDVNGTVNATAFSGNVPWSNVTGAPPLVVSTGSNSSGFSLGNTILQGMLGGIVGSATQYALSVAGTSLFDTLGNVAPGLTSQMNSWASSLLTAGTQALSAPSVTTPLLASGTGQISSSASISAPYFRSGLTSVIIDGSNNLVFTGQSASNIGCTLGQNYLAASNGPLLLQTVTGSNVSTAVTLTSSNAAVSGVLSAPSASFAALSMAVPSYTTIPVTSSGMGSTSFINVGIGQSTTTSNCGVLKYTHIGVNNSSNIFQFGLWGLNPLTAAGSGYSGVGTASPGYLWTWRET